MKTRRGFLGLFAAVPALAVVSPEPPPKRITIHYNAPKSGDMLARSRCFNRDPFGPCVEDNS